MTRNGTVFFFRSQTRKIVRFVRRDLGTIPRFVSRFLGRPYCKIKKKNTILKSRRYFVPFKIHIRVRVVLTISQLNTTLYFTDYCMFREIQIV